MEYQGVMAMFREWIFWKSKFWNSVYECDEDKWVEKAKS